VLYLSFQYCSGKDKGLLDTASPLLFYTRSARCKPVQKIISRAISSKLIVDFAHLQRRKERRKCLMSRGRSEIGRNIGEQSTALRRWMRSDCAYLKNREGEIAFIHADSRDFTENLVTGAGPPLRSL
jgi:hypothetical protein